MCGIVGLYSHRTVSEELYDSLIHLQHRGQDASGMITYNERFHMKRGLGLVSDVFTKPELEQLTGTIGIGQTRYRTAGSLHIENTPPFWVGVPYGIALAHNGNLTNCRVLRKELKEQDFHHLNSDNDAEIILHILAHAINTRLHAHAATAVSVSEARQNEEFFDLLCASVRELFSRIQGAYSCVAIIAGKGLVVFRDPHGIRPLVWGQRVTEFGTEYIFASENSMFYSLGFEYQGDVEAGEVVFIDTNAVMHRRILDKRKKSACIFEYVYFARPDAVMNYSSVYRARLYMGENLGKKWKRIYPDVLPDIVIPAPFTANTAALSIAHELQVRYSEGLYKNSFIGRTFIMPTQSARKKSVTYKLSPLVSEIKGKKVMIVDDSIVRGTTSRELVKILRDFGAREVYFVSACPPVKSPCFYGIDIPTARELIASKNAESEVRKFIGADILMYQDVDDLLEAIRRKSQDRTGDFCTACLTGEYPTPEITEEKIAEMAGDSGERIYE